jgi:hypothetical protein
MRTDSIENADDTAAAYDWRRDGWLAACALAAALLVISAATPPAAGYDKFLRVFVFCVALIRAFAAFRRGGAWLPLSAAVIAILFNPAAPLSMSHAAWVWCDLIAAAWFAIAGAWQLLSAWQPQRGWAAAAVSLAALAVPAVAAMSMPNRDALGAASLDQNLAGMNAAASAPPAPSDMNAVAAAAPTGASNAAADAASPTKSSDAVPADETRASARPLADAPAAEAANDATASRPRPAPVKTVQAPPFPGNDAASNDSGPPQPEPVGNDSGGNEEVEG